MDRRLLVIDDESEIGELVVQVATGLGFHAAAEVSAVDLAPDYLETFDLVVLDLMMPGIDGIEMLRKFSALDRKPALLLMSGLDRRMLEGARKVAEAQGLRVCETVQKPFRPAALRTILEKLATTTPRRPVAPRKALPRFEIRDVAQAIERAELVVHYQPQVALADGHWAGVEALVRWQHPEHGLLFPDAFIALAETAELALPFIEAVMDIALAGMRRLVDHAGFTGSISINMPPTALTDVKFPERLLARLLDSGVEHTRVIMEVTETSIPQNVAVSLDIVTRLRMRGIRLSIDDFGTGHSSMERLHDAPFDELKIDMVFVRKADTDPAARAIIENSVGLGHSLGMTVVAEGVETASTADWLRSIGCDIAQGYFISRPQPLDGLEAWAAARQLAAAPQAPVRSLEVLLADDSDENLAMVSEYLEGHGFAVQAARTGIEAVERAARSRFDVIVMDMQMPEMDGVEAMRRIRAAGQTVPIIALTGLAGARDRQRCIAAGATEFLGKPVRLRELLEAMRRLIG
ncbi:MAG: EAL domain-containing protein [Betaproteobacteria bacterium]